MKEPWPLNKRGTSQYRGVSYYPFTFWNEEKRRPWRFDLCYRGKRYRGQYATEREAAIAYDTKVLELGINRPLNILKQAA